MVINLLVLLKYPIFHTIKSKHALFSLLHFSPRLLLFCFLLQAIPQGIIIPLQARNYHFTQSGFRLMELGLGCRLIASDTRSEILMSDTPKVTLMEIKKKAHFLNT